MMVENLNLMTMEYIKLANKKTLLLSKTINQEPLCNIKLANKSTKGHLSMWSFKCLCVFMHV